MIKNTIDVSASDLQVPAMLDEAREFAQVYVLAWQRQKGCDGTEEMTNLKDEFRGILDELIDIAKIRSISLSASHTILIQ